MRLSRLILTTLGSCLFTSLSLTACSSEDSQFKNKLFYYFNEGVQPELSIKVNKIFNELYGFEKAKVQGIDFCRLLSNGTSKEAIMNTIGSRSIDLLDKKQITHEEAAIITLIDNSIYLAAQTAYCPEHKSMEKRH